MDDSYKPEERPLIIRRSTYTDRGLSKWSRNLSCGSILLTVMLERLAFYGLTFYFVLFLSEYPFNWIQYDAASATLIFLTVSYVFSVIGGVLADSWTGRFSSLVGSFILCIIASAMFVLLGKGKTNYENEPMNNSELLEGLCHYNFSAEGDWDKKDSSRMYMSICFFPVMSAMIVYAIGSGALRANLTPFGAEQVRYGGSRSMHSFFNWYYWAINVGSLIALLAVSFIQQNINFFYGYLVPAIALILSAIVFLIGRCWYITKKPTGSVLCNTLKILYEAVRRRKYRRAICNRITSSGCDLGFGPIPSFLDMAKSRYGGSFHDTIVEDVKSLGKVCVVFLALVPYWIVYYQMSTTFVIQGLHLNIDIKMAKDNRLFKYIPVAWLSVFNIMAVLVLLPLLDRVVFIFLENRGWQVSQLKRMSIGMFFSVLAILSAGVLENYRLKCFQEIDPLCQVNQTIGNTTYNANGNISVFAQIPQYFLIGVSEVFASVAGLEFAYSQAPRSMQGLIMGLFYLSNGLGTLIGSLFIKLVSGKGNLLTPDDSGNINKGHLDYFFFGLAFIQAIATALFCIMVYFFERKKKTDPNIQESSQREHEQGYLSVGNDGSS